MDEEDWLEIIAQVLVVGSVIAAVALIIAYLLGLLPSYGHEAPSGWRYPTDCCTGSHCHPVPCESITEKNNGYEWRGLLFTKAQTRLSGDGQCHACVYETNSEPVTPLCLFINHNS